MFEGVDYKRTYPNKHCTIQPLCTLFNFTLYNEFRNIGHGYKSCYRVYFDSIQFVYCVNGHRSIHLYTHNYKHNYAC